MHLIQLLIIQLLWLLTSSLLITAATVNSNDAIKLSTKREDVDIQNPRDKRSLGLAILFSSLLQNSAPPQPAPKATTTPPPPPPPQYIYTPGFGYQPNLPYLPDKNGYINFNPDNYVLVTPPPPMPPTTQPPPPPPPTVPLKLQKKQSFLNLLATLSAGSQPTTTTKAPPPAILIPKNLFPSYQEQLRQRVIYKYAQNDDTSSDVLEQNNEDVAPQYTYSATHADGQPASSPDVSYYQQEEEGRGPVDSSYYQSPHNAYEQSPVYSSTTPDRFRITYPDDTEYYQPPSETNQYQSAAAQSSSQEDLQSEHGYSDSYGYRS